MTISNTFTDGTPWSPYRYANEALLILEKALGMAGRVYRGYDKSASDRGAVLRIPVPQTFSAGDEPISGGTNLAPTYASVTADHWRGVRFGATDKELAFGGQQLIDLHVRPAMYALALDIDTHLAELAAKVAWQQAWSSPSALSDITAARKTLVNNSAPINDGNMHFMIDGTIEAELLNLAAFSQSQGAGDLGVATQLNGSIGHRFGFEFFTNQNCQSLTGGALTIGTALQTKGSTAAGATTISLEDSGGSLSGDVHAGDTFTVAGDTQAYVITAQQNVSTDLSALPISPAVVTTIGDHTAVTLTQTAASTQCLAFHRDAFCLAMAQLPDIPAGLGVVSAVVADPISGLSMRFRRWYDTNTNIPMVAFDWLWGVAVLNPNLAVRVTNP